MNSVREPEQVGTLVVGAGQAGLAVGYHLARQGLPFVILESNGRIGDSWRNRFDSLRLFTPARYNGLAGMPFPGPDYSFPGKNEVADYLEGYAAQFKLPVRTGVKVDGLSRNGGDFIISAGPKRFAAGNVVLATAPFQVPRVPSFAGELDPGILQMHSSEYRNRSQLRKGGVLIAGAGNSGHEIALEAATHHTTWLSGRNNGHAPFRIDGPYQRLIFPLVWFIGQHVLSVHTPIGRRLRPYLRSHGVPVIRVKPREIAAAGIERVPKVAGVKGGLPVLVDRRVLKVANVVWCTGYRSDFSWIGLPGFGGDGDEDLLHERGIVASQPGLYFAGLLFLSSMTSSLLGGADRDAERIVQVIASRARGDHPGS